MERKIVTISGPTKFIVFQPGNGTKYETAFVPMVGADYSDTLTDKFLFCWINPLDNLGRSLVLQGSAWNTIHPLNYQYFMDKMQCSAGDAAALLSLIREITGRTIEFPPGFGSDGLAKSTESYS